MLTLSSLRRRVLGEPVCGGQGQPQQRVRHHGLVPSIHHVCMCPHHTSCIVVTSCDCSRNWGKVDKPILNNLTGFVEPGVRASYASIHQHRHCVLRSCCWYWAALTPVARPF